MSYINVPLRAIYRALPCSICIVFLQANLSLEVWSEVISPFDLLPRGMLQGTGSAVISSLVNGLLPVFMRRFVFL